MSNKPFKILSIIGSPHDGNSNTRALVEDFVEELSTAGVTCDHQVMGLGKYKIEPCRGCWACTKGKSCPVKNDDLDVIKKAMIECDMLIIGSPVYTNQVSAQLKMLFDRLFTWCHVFPLLGKYSLSAVTTANDGQKETGDFIEKMLATYGTYSLGTIIGTGAYTAGFFPQRITARKKNQKTARKAAQLIQKDTLPKESKWLKRMFRAMKRKITGVHTINYIVNGQHPDMPNPPKLMVKLINSIRKKKNVPWDDTVKLSKLMEFELRWWKDRNWLKAKSLKELIEAEPVSTFEIKERLLLELANENNTVKNNERA